MAEERIYTIPLRREFLKAPKYKRTSRAVKVVRDFLKKHMKSDDVKIGKYLNLELWEHGRKNPPGKIQVKVTKEDNVVKAELINAPEEVKETKKEEKKKEEAKITEPKEEQKEKEEKEKKEVLEKGLKEKEKLVKEEKIKPKEQDALQKSKKVISKIQKPHHEKKK